MHRLHRRRNAVVFLFSAGKHAQCVQKLLRHPIVLSSEYVRRCMTERIDLADGCVRVLLDIEERYYYEMLSEYAGEKIENAQDSISPVFNGWENGSISTHFGM